MKNVLNVKDEEFEPIYSDIVNRYLSKTNFPKFIVGTGLSIGLGVSGMSGLAKELEKKFNSDEYSSYLHTWKQYEGIVNDKGLEYALLNIKPEEEEFVESIREITAEFILDSDYNARKYILSNHSGFENLIGFLSRTVSVNDKVIDIMTPNYDLIIELIVDKLKLESTLGFYGSLYQNFNQDRLKSPRSYFSKDEPIVRLFKPHGSINWIKQGSNVIQTNDYNYLKKESKNIEIITPGSMKYQRGLTHALFRIHREIFNELITDNKNKFSIFIYGYGFNDQHFDTVFENTTKDVIVLTMNIKKEIVDKALGNRNWTLFYKHTNEEELGENSYMIYNQKLYKIDTDLWDINEFSKIFIE